MFPRVKTHFYASAGIEPAPSIARPNIKLTPYPLPRVGNCYSFIKAFFPKKNISVKLARRLLSISAQYRTEPDNGAVVLSGFQLRASAPAFNLVGEGYEESEAGDEQSPGVAFDIDAAGLADVQARPAPAAPAASNVLDPSASLANLCARTGTSNPKEALAFLGTLGPGGGS